MRPDQSSDATRAAPRVAAVIVTHNRRELLLESLAAVRAQTRPPDLVVVIDNASADGSAAAVRERFADVQLVRLPENYGGAGGFACGMSAALAGGADWLWLMDDDTVPEPGALPAMLAAVARYPGRQPSLLASRVVWTDGRDHPMNTPRPWRFAGRKGRQAAAAVGCLPVRSASFVSLLVRAADCRVAGLPRADFFLWNDDFDFTTRLLRGRIGLACPASVVVHKTAVFGGTETATGDRFYYEVRNKIWTFRSDGLAVPERLLFAASTLRRWLRTYAGSADRGALRSALRRGIIAGITTAPRPNEQVLGSGDPGSAVLFADTERT